VSQTVDNDLLTKAVVALVKHHNDTVNKAYQESKTTPLLGTDVAIHVQFTLTRVPERISHKPIRLTLPHSLFQSDTQSQDDDLDSVDVCLIVKDDAKEGIKELIDSLPRHKSLSRIKKVLTLTSLRKKYGRFADRRELLARFDIFMADDRILPMLGRALGKNFFEKKKQPIPIRVTRTQQLPSLVDACLRGTFLFIRPGTCLSVKYVYHNSLIPHP
jgi:ribosome biogenesis protein UTP30